MRHARPFDPRPRVLAVALAGAAVLACGPGAPTSEPDPAGGADGDSTASDPTVYRLVEIEPDVYATVVREGVNPSQWATSLIVVRSDHVLVVDTRQHAPAADELLATVARVTDLPIRYVVNTHWHGDHVQGNAAFRAAFPDLRIIGGATVPEDMRTLGRERLDGEIARGDGRIAAARGWLESGERDDGTPLTDEEKTALPDQIEAARAYVEARRAVEAGLSLDEAGAAADFGEFEAHFTRHLADRPPEERHERYAAFVDETLARGFAEASGALAPGG